MKKFVFSNEKYQGIKEKEYQRLKRDMQNTDKEIDMAMAVQASLDEEFRGERERFHVDCKKGVSARELQRYQGFFSYIQERREEALARLDSLNQRKQELSDALVRVHNELKVLGDMRSEQYQAYCKELAAEEEKELDGHLSFTMFEKAV